MPCNTIYLDSIVHGICYNNVPLTGHGYTAGELEMTFSTSGCAEEELEVSIHVKNLPHKHREKTY